MESGSVPVGSSIFGISSWVSAPRLVHVLLDREELETPFLAPYKKKREGGEGGMDSVYGDQRLLKVGQIGPRDLGIPDQ